MSKPTSFQSGAILLSCVVFALASCATGETAPQEPHVVFVVGDHEYSSERVLPKIAAELEQNYGMRTTVLLSHPDEYAEENLPGLEALEDADLAVFYLRWRRLPADQVEHIQDYIDRGGHVVGFRTSTHAFNYPEGHELEHWNAYFGEGVLGSPPGWGGIHYHYGAQSSTDVRVIPEAANHPILSGVDDTFHVRSWLYNVRPGYPPEDATLLLMGEAVDPNREDAQESPVAWTWQTEAGGRVFTTTMGHPEDFDVAPFQRLVVNGIHWAAGLDIPQPWAGPIAVNVPYEKEE